jgi:hypothetical protein
VFLRSLMLCGTLLLGVLAISSAVAQRPTIRILRGQVIESGSRASVPDTNIRLVGFNGTATLTNGDFGLEVPQPPLTPGTQVRLAVDGWEVIDPHMGVGGAMFVPKDFDPPLLVLVARGTPAALQDARVIQSLLEQYCHSPVSVKQPLTFDRFLASRSSRYAVDPKKIQEEARSWPKYLKDDQYSRGLFQVALGNDADAVSLLRPSLKSSYEALVASGLAEYRQAHYEQADSLWTEAAGRQARDPIVLNNLAVTKARREQMKDAQQLFTRAFSAIEPGDPLSLKDLIFTNQTALIPPVR